jgi:hypothetical protein
MLLLKIQFFWCMMLCCWVCRYHGFEGSYCLYLQSKKFLILDFLTQKMMAPWFFKTLGTTLPTNQYHILKKIIFITMIAAIYLCIRISVQSLLRFVFNVRSARQSMLLCLPICSILTTLIIVTNKASSYTIPYEWNVRNISAPTADGIQWNGFFSS